MVNPGRIILGILLFAVIILTQPHCAKVVAPTGGPKDTIPPVLVRSNPEMFSTNFKGNRVSLYFDEFVQLRETMKKLVLSPPQDQLPEFQMRGKRIDFEFSEPLRENTTHTLYLSDAIADNNEGNRIPNFEFAFSTGIEIDTLSLAGRVVDAFSLDPLEGVFVMLYSSFEDSLPITQKPSHVTKSSKEGLFRLNNIGAAEYKIFALVDQNTNYLFDQITESIGFLNVPIPDSLLKPRSHYPNFMVDETMPSNLLTLYLFVEETRVQSLTDISRKHRRSITLGFSKNPSGDVSIKPIGVATSEHWYITERNIKGDSLTFWITDTTISNIDTLSIQAHYYRTDSLFNLFRVTDTLRAFYFPTTSPTDPPRRRRHEEVEKKPITPVKTSVTGGTSMLPNQPIELSLTMPPYQAERGYISLLNLRDSVWVESFTFEPDTLNPRKYRIEYPWEANVSYELVALPGAFIDLDGLPNDTLKLTIRGANPEEFGTIMLDLKGVTPNVIVQLITDKGVVIDAKAATEDTTVVFSFVRPGKYSFRFIKDTNMDGVWNTGRYMEGLQPERVILYEENGKPNIITVRANWEYELNYTF